MPQKKSQILKLKKNTGIDKYSPTKTLLNEEFISKVIWDCLEKNDPEGVMEALEAHSETLNKVKLAQETDISRSTLYNNLHAKNPTIKTLAKLIHAFF